MYVVQKKPKPKPTDSLGRFFEAVERKSRFAVIDRRRAAYFAEQANPNSPFKPRRVRNSTVRLRTVGKD